VLTPHATIRPSGRSSRAPPRSWIEVDEGNAQTVQQFAVNVHVSRHSFQGIDEQSAIGEIT